MYRPGSALNRAWRIFATGLSFTVFGVGGALLGFTLFPLLRLTSRDRAVVRRRIQRAMSISFRLFIFMMRALRILSWEAHGLERLDRPGQLIVANHPSLIDVVYLISFLPAVDCIVKQALWKNPFLRWPVVWGGYISNTSGEQLIEDCARTLKAGNSLIVFPEGTRTVPGRPISMKRGAAQIALAAGVDLTPVTITCQPTTLTKAEPWYRIPPSKPHWILTVGEPIAIRPFLETAGSPALAARHLTQHLERYFSESVARQQHLAAASPSA